MPTKSEIYDEADKLKDSGDLEGAVKKLEEALAIDPDFPLAHSAMAIVLQRLGKHAKAVDHAKRVCDLQPDDAFSFTALSVTYQRAYAGTGEMNYIQLAEEAMERSRRVQMGG